MSAKKLQEAFAAWSAERLPLVLATVFETEGSTYSKTGAQMLITGDGRFQGMLSGGCLEGDLAERAASVIASGKPQAVTYDLGQNDEELWGLGVGCDGLMRIFLQAVTIDNDYQPLRSMAVVLSGNTTEKATTVLESTHPGLPAGASLVTHGKSSCWSDIDEQFRADLQGTGNTPGVAVVAIEDYEVRFLTTLLEPPPRILVLGAGLDAEPVVRLIDELGWRATVSDHRPAYIEQGTFAAAELVQCCPAAEATANIDLDTYSAALVMSHHLDSDRVYLHQLAESAIPYIGLLGPLDRRRRLLDEIGAAADKIVDRIHGPAGLDIGARGPAPIALSIVAEIFQVLMTAERR